MTQATNLQELYVEELKDLWSANDQMARALKKIAPQATHAKLKSMLESSPRGIEKHTALLKTLIEAQDGEVSKDHCKAMEGLVGEAVKHTVDDAPAKGAVLDASIIAQYQRMTHYGIAGFGTVAAFARALKLDDDSKAIKSAVSDMYSADELMTEIAESAVNLEAVEG
jgi:ferritin-like metal-binding protein YciE